MISPQLARALQVAGLRWRPASGDIFLIDQPGFEGDFFTLSDMTIEAHEFSTGTVLGFNGTTEWALDSVALDDALWLPAEHQLRSLLGNTFRALRRIGDGRVENSPADPLDAAFGGDFGAALDADDDLFGPADGYEVETILAGETAVFTAVDAADAYAGALLELISASIDAPEFDIDF